MYALSERYCIDAGNDNELLLQITIDNFNRHYVYRHDLTVSIVQNTYNFLTQMSLKKSMLLEYHLLLLEYLTLKMNDKTQTVLYPFCLRRRHKSMSEYECISFSSKPPIS